MQSPLCGNSELQPSGGMGRKLSCVVYVLACRQDPVEKIPTAWEHPSIASTFISSLRFLLIYLRSTHPSLILCEDALHPLSLDVLRSRKTNAATLALTAPPAQGQAWGRWPDQQRQPPSVDNYYTPMDISGIVQSSYDSRAASSAPMNRAMAAPQYVPHPPYSAAPAEGMVLPQQEMPAHHHPFNFNSFPNASINILVSGLPDSSYLQTRLPPRLAQPGVDGRRSYAPNSHQAYVDDYHSQTPPIKPEPLWSPTAESTASMTSKSTSASSRVLDPEPVEVTFDTEVDTLMKAIQAKSQVAPPSQQPSNPTQRASQNFHYVHGAGAAGAVQDGKEDSQDDSKNGKRRYQCQVKNCMKSFYQKTHLDIHERAHTGIKPYVSAIMLSKQRIELISVFRLVRNPVAAVAFPSWAT